MEDNFKKDSSYNTNNPDDLKLTTENNSQKFDEFIIGEGFNISSDDVPIIKKKKNTNSAFKTLVWVVSIVIVSLSLAFGIIYVGADFIGLGFGRDKTCVMEVKPGTPAVKIANQLKDCGAVKLPIFFRLYAKINGYDSQFKYGLYTFDGESGYKAIAEMLVSEGAKAESVRVTIPEGTGINDFIKNVNGENVTVPGIATILENAGVCSKSDFLYALQEVKYDSKLLKNVNVGKTYCELEGYLFPNTYEFFAYDSEECARLVVQKLIEESEKRITDGMYSRAEKMGYTMNNILTMASIIQMEAGNNTSEMTNVAAVFYNRLNSNEFATLGSSPTCYYGTFHSNDDGRYNTYNIEGLPPGPLCSPGIDAINAALYPTTDSPYYYFVTDKNGNFYYHKTLNEQQVTINRLQKESNWVYEYFE